MRSSRIRTKARINKKNNMVRLIIDSEPEKMIGIKTNQIYSQIARTGRNPNRIAERALLISALNNATTSVSVNGRTIKKIPPYVPMKVSDVKLCFGRQIDRLADSSLVQIAE